MIGWLLSIAKSLLASLALYLAGKMAGRSQARQEASEAVLERVNDASNIPPPDQGESDRIRAKLDELRRAAAGR